MISEAAWRDHTVVGFSLLSFCMFVVPFPFLFKSPFIFLPPMFSCIRVLTFSNSLHLWVIHQVSCNRSQRPVESVTGGGDG